MNSEIPASAHHQVRILREALEKAGRTATANHEAAAQALGDLQIERKRLRQVIEALEMANQRVLEVEAENRRLRSIVGGMQSDSHSLSKDLRELLREVRNGAPVASLPATVPAAAGIRHRSAA